MATRSIWLTVVGDSAATGPVGGDSEADVVIVGGGITGLSLALLLTESGRRVIVLEAGRIGGGTTGHSTGNLYETVGDMAALAKRWDPDVLRQVTLSRRAAVGWIRDTAARLGIDCGFRQCPQMLCAVTADAAAQVEQQRDAWLAAGLAVVDAGLPPSLGAASGPCIVLPDQAQFHAVAWVQGLAREVLARGGRIFENSPVIELDHSSRTAVTAAGRIRGGDLVLATHTPKGLHPVHAEMPVHREYVLAWPVPQPLPPGIFWLRGDALESVRGLEADRQSWLICAGPEYKTGMHDAAQCVQQLADAARRRFGVGEAAFAWSAQNYQGADGLPYIGRDLSGALIATGFRTDGLTWGTVAAQALADAIAGRDNPMLRLCRPGRLSPIKGAKAIVDENLTVAKSLVRDYLTHREVEAISALSPGSGAIVDVEGRTVAAYRDPGGVLHAVSPTCTHMGCRVHWNPVETSWDCPCHGSRFRPDGAVIEGPAVKPLVRISTNRAEPAS